MKKYIQFIHKIRNKFNSTDDYYEFQRFQAQWILNNLTKKINFDLCVRIVLDLGSGKWGYTTKLVEKCIFVCGFDLNMSKKISNRENINFLKDAATNLPFKNGLFDFVFYSSLNGYVFNQEKVICEIIRVLKNESFYYLSFPTTICYVNTIIKLSYFKIVNIRTRFLLINIVNISLLCEFLTWHGEFLLQKRGDYY